MNSFLKRNWALVLAFVLPVIIILVVAVESYLPSLSVKTNYNFVYATCNGRYYYDCNSIVARYYSVVDGKLVIKPIDNTIDTNKDGTPDAKENYDVHLFLLDTGKNESKEISVADAQAMTLNGLVTSPDGVTVTSGYSGGGGFFLFDSPSTYGNYLSKGNGRVKLNTINANGYAYDQSFKFIGWVIPARS